MHGTSTNVFRAFPCPGLLFRLALACPSSFLFTELSPSFSNSPTRVFHKTFRSQLAITTLACCLTWRNCFCFNEVLLHLLYFLEPVYVRSYLLFAVFYRNYFDLLIILAINKNEPFFMRNSCINRESP